MNVDKCEVMESDEHENSMEGMEDEVILKAYTVGQNKKYKL